MPRGGKRPGAGRPRKAVAMPLPEEDLAQLAGGDVLANAKANFLVAQSLFKSAIDGNVRAQIYWAETRMGWGRDGALPEPRPNTGVLSGFEHLDEDDANTIN